MPKKSCGMNKHNEENSFSKGKEIDGLIKQCVLSIALGIAILVFMLLTSGIFFTGAVVTHMNGAIKESRQK